MQSSPLREVATNLRSRADQITGTNDDSERMAQISKRAIGRAVEAEMRCLELENQLQFVRQLDTNSHFENAISSVHARNITTPENDPEGRVLERKWQSELSYDIGTRGRERQYTKGGSPEQRNETIHHSQLSRTSTPAPSATYHTKHHHRSPTGQQGGPDGSSQEDAIDRIAREFEKKIETGKVARKMLEKNLAQTEQQNERLIARARAIERNATIRVIRLVANARVRHRLCSCVHRWFSNQRVENILESQSLRKQFEKLKLDRLTQELEAAQEAAWERENELVCSMEERLREQREAGKQAQQVCTSCMIIFLWFGSVLCEATTTEYSLVHCGLCGMTGCAAET